MDDLGIDSIGISLLRLEDLDEALQAQPPQLSFPVVGTDAAQLERYRGSPLGKGSHDYGCN